MTFVNNLKVGDSAFAKANDGRAVSHEVFLIKKGRKLAVFSHRRDGVPGSGWDIVVDMSYSGGRHFPISRQSCGSGYTLYPDKAACESRQHALKVADRIMNALQFSGTKKFTDSQIINAALALGVPCDKD